MGRNENGCQAKPDTARLWLALMPDRREVRTRIPLVLVDTMAKMTRGLGGGEVLAAHETMEAGCGLPLGQVTLLASGSP